MNADAVLVIGGVVGTLCKFLYQAGLRGRWTTVAAIAGTTVSVAIWGYSHADFARETSWDYFAGWAAVLLLAAGTFHTLEHAPDTAASANRMVRTLTGTGDGQ